MKHLCIESWGAQTELSYMAEDTRKSRKVGVFRIEASGKCYHAHSMHSPLPPKLAD